jgi:hypothetical protein
MKRIIYQIIDKQSFEMTFNEKDCFVYQSMNKLNNNLPRLVYALTHTAHPNGSNSRQNFPSNSKIIESYENCWLNKIHDSYGFRTNYNNIESKLTIIKLKTIY